MKRAENFREGIKSQCDEGCGRILLGDNTGDREVLLGPIRYQCVGVCVVNSVYNHFRLAPNFTQRNERTNRGVSDFMCIRLSSCVQRYSGLFSYEEI